MPAVFIPDLLSNKQRLIQASLDFLSFPVPAPFSSFASSIRLKYYSFVFRKLAGKKSIGNRSLKQSENIFYFFK